MASAGVTRTFALQIKAGGRVVLPAELRAALDVQEGDSLHGEVRDGELRVMSRDAAIRKAQATVRKYVPEGVSLVDQLIEDRRTEAQREDP